jgi:hypothetical protein
LQLLSAQAVLAVQMELEQAVVPQLLAPLAHLEEMVAMVLAT